MAAKKTTGAASRPATRSSTSTSTSTSTGRSGTRAKPTPQAASKAKATPASKGRAKVATKAASSKGPGLTAEEEKLLKDLAEKKKKAAEEAAEAKKKASRKRAADCLLEEAGEDNEGSDAEPDSDSLLDSPVMAGTKAPTGIVRTSRPTSRRRLDSPFEPGEDDEGSNMVSKVLDDGVSSDLEEDTIHDQAGEGKEVDDGGQDQDREAFAGEETVVGEEEEEESKKHVSIIPRSKAKLSDLSSPRTKRIAISAHKAMRLHVATVNGFPSSCDREELCWNLLVSSTRENEILWEKMSLIQSDDDLKAYLIDYTWKAASQVRGELVAKARITVPGIYGVGELKYEELEDALKWLLEEARFIHAGIEVKNFIHDDTSPLQNTIFRSLLSTQWWGPKGEGRKSGQKQNPFFNNLPVLALISCAVECVLLGIMRGSPMDFSEAHFSPRWDHYMNLLQNFQKECPSYVEMIWDELKEAVWKGNAPAPTEDTKASFNFSALETAGRAAKARKSASDTGSRSRSPME